MKTVKSACRICVTCGFDLHVEDNKIVDFGPDFGDPFSKGYCCPKGIAGIEFQQGVGGKRLMESLKKQPDGSFEKVDTLNAASEIGEKLKAIIDEHGPRSVALFFGTGGYHNSLGSAFSKSWLYATGSPNLFTTMTIDQSSHWVTAGRMGVYMGGIPALESIDVGLVAGANPMVAHTGWPGVPMYAFNPGENYKKMRDRGQKLIVVDPRVTESAERATLHLQLIAGEDATLYAGIIRLLFKNDWVNKEFCERFATHVDRLRQQVEPFTEEYVATRAGVSVEKLQQAAKLLGTAKKPFAGCSTGTSMAPNSNLADFLLVSINVLLGGYRREGDVVTRRMHLNQEMPALEAVIPPNRTWDEGVKCRTQDIGHIFGEFPSAIFPDEILQPGKDKIRAMVVYGANPVMSMADPDKTMAALKDLDLLVTLENYVTETAELSDYVLATAPQYERYDYNGFTEAFYSDDYLAYWPPVVEKPDTVAHDWEVFWTMAKAMGLRLELKHSEFGMPFGQLPVVDTLDMQTMPEGEAMVRQIFESKGIDFDAVKAAPRGIAPESPEIKVMAAPEDSGARLDLCPDDIAEDINTLYNTAPATSRYRLSNRRVVSVMNAMLRDSNLAQKKSPGNFAYMNPDDMADDELTDGQRITISTDSGKIIGVVRSDETMRRGVISMTHCFGAMNPEDDPEGVKGGHTSRLIPLDPERAEAINFMPHATGIPVDVCPYPN